MSEPKAGEFKIQLEMAEVAWGLYRWRLSSLISPHWELLGKFSNYADAHTAMRCLASGPKYFTADGKPKEVAE